MAEQIRQRESTQEAAGAAPSPAELLRAALEKIVFFEWRLGELAAELAAAQTRAATATAERALAEESARAAQVQAQAARLSLAELEAERARLAALLARPAHATHESGAELALEAERARASQLKAERDELRREVLRQRAERERWLSEMIEQARSGGEAPAALAEFISELRGEVLALREREKITDAMMGSAGMTVPPPARQPAPAPRPEREAGPVEEARALWAEGRLGGAEAAQDRAHAEGALRAGSLSPAASAMAATSRGAEPQDARGAGGISHDARLIAAAQGNRETTASRAPRESGAARALAEQCLRGLQAPEAARRAQAAHPLAAVPSAAAAPLLAHALGLEQDARARAALVRALVACGGEGAAELAQGMLLESEPALVRMAALEALAGLGGDRARTALEAGSRDPAAAVRRRTAALLLSALDGGDLLARLAQDQDESVRASSAPREAEAAGAPSAPPPRDLEAEALLACRATIFGLSDGELAQALALELEAAAPLIARLVDKRRLARRGKRLIAAGQPEARGEERR